MMITIKCPGCGTEGKMSVLEANYSGPYKCWKCRALFQINIIDNEVREFEPLSQEEFEQQQELQALKDKFKQK